MIITIDGPVATGKSSVARKVAEKLGFVFFDTGAMYRCLTYAVLTQHVNLENPKEVENFLLHFHFEIKIEKGERHYYVGKENVSDKIRQAEVTASVSKVSAIPAVRHALVPIQHAFAEGVDAVFEGRDMGTDVFPQADLKIFLSGRPEVRAKRRFDELRAKFPDNTQQLTLEKCLQDITQRDLYDSTRETSPLRKAADAHIVDTSDLSLDQVVERILSLVKGLRKD